MQQTMKTGLIGMLRTNSSIARIDQISYASIIGNGWRSIETAT